MFGRYPCSALGPEGPSAAVSGGPRCALLRCAGCGDSWFLVLNYPH